HPDHGRFFPPSAAASPLATRTRLANGRPEASGYRQKSRSLETCGMMSKRGGEVKTKGGLISRGAERGDGNSANDLSQSPALTALADATDSAKPRRTGPSTKAGTARSGASRRFAALRGNSVR